MKKPGASKAVGWMDSEGPVTVPSGRPHEEHNDQSPRGSGSPVEALVAKWRQWAEVRQRKSWDRVDDVAQAVDACADELDAALQASTPASGKGEALRAYMQHKPDCWLKYETRDLVPSSGGFGVQFRQPDDPEPSCTCGLDALLAPPVAHPEGAHER